MTTDLQAPRKKRFKVQSLRLRVVLISVLWIALALVVTGHVLNQLFEDHVREQYQRQLQVYADYVLADIGQGPDGQPKLERAQQNPRFVKPLSGLYWQINDEQGNPVLRSRSLWDQALVVPKDSLASNQTHFHMEQGPQDKSVLLLEQIVRFEWSESRRWRLLVAENSDDLTASVADWQRSLALFLSVLFVGLLLAVVAQAFFGFTPLRRLQRAITALRQGTVSRLEGDYPSEFAPLVTEFNAVLQANEKIIDRARAQAGDLAHAIKTPITVINNATDRALRADIGQAEFVELIQQQLQSLQSTVDWRLRRARLAAQLGGVSARSTPVAPVLRQLLEVMQKLYADRGVLFEADIPDTTINFDGESQDLMEILGNLLDNAGKWAKHRVQVRVTKDARHVVISVDDDGEGLEPDQMDLAIRRGIRLDEQVHGSGLGLAIVRDMVDLYEGSIELSDSLLGGLSVQVKFPVKDRD